MNKQLEQKIIELIGEDKIILDRIDAEDNPYWKRDRNHDIGYNKAKAEMRAKAPELAKSIIDMMLNEYGDFNDGAGEYWTTLKKELKQE